MSHDQQFQRDVARDSNDWKKQHPEIASPGQPVSQAVPPQESAPATNRTEQDREADQERRSQALGRRSLAASLEMTQAARREQSTASSGRHTSSASRTNSTSNTISIESVRVVRACSACVQCVRAVHIVRVVRIIRVVRIRLVRLIPLAVLAVHVALDA